MKTAAIPEVIKAFNALTKYRLKLVNDVTQPWDGCHTAKIENDVENLSLTLINLCALVETEDGEVLSRVEIK